MKNSTQYLIPTAVIDMITEVIGKTEGNKLKKNSIIKQNSTKKGDRYFWGLKEQLREKLLDKVISLQVDEAAENNQDYY